MSKRIMGSAAASLCLLPAAPLHRMTFRSVDMPCALRRRYHSLRKLGYSRKACSMNVLPDFGLA